MMRPLGCVASWDDTTFCPHRGAGKYSDQTIGTVPTDLDTFRGIYHVDVWTAPRVQRTPTPAAVGHLAFRFRMVHMQHGGGAGDPRAGNPRAAQLWRCWGMEGCAQAAAWLAVTERARTEAARLRS